MYRDIKQYQAYQKAYRKKNKKKKLAYQKAYYKKNEKKIASYRKSYYKKNKARIFIVNKAYREIHKKRIKAYNARYRKTHKEAFKRYRNACVEHTSVRTHYNNIFNPKAKSHKNYIGMPFCDEWNPAKGGSFKAGAAWIIEHLGKRPKGSTLHVIDHAVGFMPNNLEWTHPRKQNNQQMYKIIAQQRHRIKELEKQIKILRACI